LNKHQLPQGYDMVVIARMGAAQLDQAGVDEELKVLVQRPF
ncbi:MAG: ribonuclease P protein component, partial [Thermodesulfobacteriota bacterium]